VHTNANPDPVTPLAEIFARDSLDPAVAVADGYGLRVRVERGQLVVDDGIGAARRQRRYRRSQRGLRRLLLLGHTGTLSLEAVRWCRDAKVSLVVLDSDGQVILADGPPGADDARLRRIQAVSAGTDVGLGIARELLTAKLTGHRSVLRDALGRPELAERFERHLGELAAAENSRRLREVEAYTAAEYWDAWDQVTLRFARLDARRVPEHWAAPYPGRRSELMPVTGDHSRNATHPINALINYATSLAEVESRLACTALGLDPGLGFLHTDERNRDSLALDLLEVVRPDVERHVLTLVEERTFRATDFTETRQGTCRLLPPVTHLLAEQILHWARLVAPWAEAVRRALAEADGRVAVTTPLTQSNFRAANRQAGRRAAPGEQPTRWADVRRPPSPPPLKATCLTCGAPLARRARVHCDTCIPGVRAVNAVAFSAAGASAAARRAAEGQPQPQHTPEAVAKRARTASVRQLANIAWEREHPGPLPDPALFREQILPGLRDLPLRELAQATGLSKATCGRIRRGDDTPHPRHWAALTELGRISS
jgi:CRISPR-associated endonuclease Cas1